MLSYLLALVLCSFSFGVVVSFFTNNSALNLNGSLPFRSKIPQDSLHIYNTSVYSLHNTTGKFNYLYYYSTRIIIVCQFSLVI